MYRRMSDEGEVDYDPRRHRRGDGYGAKELAKMEMEQDKIILPQQPKQARTREGKSRGGERVSEIRKFDFTVAQEDTNGMEMLACIDLLKQQLQQGQAERDEMKRQHPDLPYLIHPQQQTCKVCGRPDKFDFHLPDDLWQTIVPEEYRDKVVCLYCLDEFAAAKAIDYKSHLSEICFAGTSANLVLVDIRQREVARAQVAVLLDEDRLTQLRHLFETYPAEPAVNLVYRCFPELEPQP